MEDMLKRAQRNYFIIKKLCELLNCSIEDLLQRIIDLKEKTEQLKEQL